MGNDSTRGKTHGLPLSKIGRSIDAMNAADAKAMLTRLNGAVADATRLCRGLGTPEAKRNLDRVRLTRHKFYQGLSVKIKREIENAT
jgi:hypothetical protein